MEYLSKERHDEIVAELNHLINVEYPKIKDDLSPAPPLTELPRPVRGHD